MAPFVALEKGGKTLRANIQSYFVHQFVFKDLCAPGHHGHSIMTIFITFTDFF